MLLEIHFKVYFIFSKCRFFLRLNFRMGIFHTEVYVTICWWCCRNTITAGRPRVFHPFKPFSIIYNHLIAILSVFSFEMINMPSSEISKYGLEEALLRYIDNNVKSRCRMNLKLVYYSICKNWFLLDCWYRTIFLWNNAR